MPFDTRRRFLVCPALALLLLVNGCRGAAMPDPGLPAHARLTDERIVGAALLLNNTERGDAAVATLRAVDADVLAYARRIQTDHASLDATLTALVEGFGIVAQDDPHGGAVRDSAIARRERLQSVAVRAFDAAYVSADLGAQREALAMVGIMLSNARRPALREYLAALRPVLAAHVAHAEQLRATLAARAR